ncbi:zinc-dependent metalloprotease [Mycobacterium sp. MAA66]|uniref:zinc-dependent metalloprotease n=1 Tax=Mycobacterium sp. MAA66 TaxID=3156297 RepID=UPI0035127DAD
MRHVTQTPTVGRTVDWGFAATVGVKLTRPAPVTTDYTRDQACAQLADSARRAELPVREVTLLNEGAEVSEARVIDRPQWVRAATESMRVMTGGTTASPDGMAAAIAGRITGAQTGAVLAFVSSGILGQYDPFGDGGGELLLIYPNIIATERQLRVDPADFRLWVCLHEVTHRVQFRANPWLTGHMSQALAVLTDDAGLEVGDISGRLAEFLRDRRDGDADPNSQGILGIMRVLQNDEQRRAMDQLLVLGTLLEGHADHVMDAVGPAVVPSVVTIRNRFDARRNRSHSPLQRIIRALLGFDAKVAQYTRGKKFVDEVVSTVGMKRFNAIWTDAETLPLPTEIDEPRRWIDRVL